MIGNRFAINWPRLTSIGIDNLSIQGRLYTQKEKTDSRVNSTKKSQKKMNYKWLNAVIFSDTTKKSGFMNHQSVISITRHYLWYPIVNLVSFEFYQQHVTFFHKAKIRKQFETKLILNIARYTFLNCEDNKHIYI